MYSCCLLLHDNYLQIQQLKNNKYLLFHMVSESQESGAAYLGGSGSESVMGLQSRRWSGPWPRDSSTRAQTRFQNGSLAGGPSSSPYGPFHRAAYKMVAGLPQSKRGRWKPEPRHPKWHSITSAGFQPWHYGGRVSTKVGLSGGWCLLCLFGCNMHWM